MIKFRTRYDARIEEIEVIRETAQSVYFASDWACYSNGRREAKRTANGYNYFDTWAEAKAFLVYREQSAIRNLKQQIADHEETLRKIEED